MVSDLDRFVAELEKEPHQAGARPEPAKPVATEEILAHLERESKCFRAPVNPRPKALGTDKLAPCGSDRCNGCYEVEPGVRIHPPKSSEDWKEWLLKWEPKGRVQ